MQEIKLELLSVSFKDFCQITTSKEIEFFCELFKLEFFKKAILNNAKFTLISLQECLDFIENGKLIEGLDENDTTFVFFQMSLIFNYYIF